MKLQANLSKAKAWCAAHGFSIECLKENEDGSVTFSVTFE